jgi:hypothetical protein
MSITKINNSDNFESSLPSSTRNKLSNKIQSELERRKIMNCLAIQIVDELSTSLINACYSNITACLIQLNDYKNALKISDDAVQFCEVGKIILLFIIFKVFNHFISYIFNILIV